MEVSIFKNFNKVVSNKDLTTVMEVIRNGRYKTQVEQLQILLLKGKQKEYKKKKKSLPAFTPSGRFLGGRKMEFLQEYSKLLILDIDKLDVEKLNQVKKITISDKYTNVCFISPSGKGLKILVKVSSSIAKHKDAFETVKIYYESLLKTEIDPSGKDITRLCFFSYDKDLYFNPQSEIFIIEPTMDTVQQIEELIIQIHQTRTDITRDYDTWLKIGFAIESEFGEQGRTYFHSISKYNHDYSPETCNEQYNKCVKNNNSGITIATLYHYAKNAGLKISKNKNQHKLEKEPNQKHKQVTTNKFTITEEYLNQRYEVRYNVISNNFEYKSKEEQHFKEMNENNMFIKLQKDNINISLSHLIALLKSDFVKEFNVFKDYFENLQVWDGNTDYIQELTNYLITDDKQRLDNHFKKWLVRTVRNAIDNNYFNKQCFVLVSNKQNSGKSTFCRFLCPPQLNNYIVESIGTDKDSQIAITENFLINLDELSQADKNEINAFKSMFSKDKVKARLTYDKRPTVHARRASFMGSTDRWEFLTDENGSVRWLCFDIENINWNYKKEIDINKVWSQAYYLLTKTKFVYDLTIEEIKENDFINKRYQVSSPERDLIMKYFKKSNKEKGKFLTATEILEYISGKTRIVLNSRTIGKELKFLGFERISKRKETNIPVYGYYIEYLKEK